MSEPKITAQIINGLLKDKHGEDVYVFQCKTGASWNIAKGHLPQTVDFGRGRWYTGFSCPNYKTVYHGYYWSFFCLYRFLIDMAPCIYGSQAQPGFRSGSYSSGQMHGAFFVLTAKTIRRPCYA